MIINLFVLICAARANIADLPKVNANIKEVTVSGVSSGAYMASQMHYAFSEYIRGCGIFAGGPYLCSLGDAERAVSTCMEYPIQIDLSVLQATTDSLALTGWISSTSYLQGSRVYIYSGLSDKTVLTQVATAGEKMYTNYGAHVLTEYDINSGHCIPTLDYGVACEKTNSPYLNKCNYAGVAKSLQWIYNDLKQGVAAIADNLIEFDQTKYLTGASFQTNGYVYIPTACRSGAQCKVHVAFHGCKMGSSLIGKEFVSHAGYNEIAESNNIVILYPQVKESLLLPTNPEGCWDWWGYTDLNPAVSTLYATQEGVQMGAIWKMLDQLTTASA